MASESPEFKQVADEFREFNEKMRDPLVVGALLNRLAQERQSTNLILKEIHEKLEKLESKVSAIESRQPPEATVKPEMLLGEVDAKLVDFINSKDRVCAEDVRKEFGYNGKNAASARLNALWKHGVLEKKFAGRTAFFITKSR